jgi:hypothetical protein
MAYRRTRATLLGALVTTNPEASAAARSPGRVAQPAQLDGGAVGSDAVDVAEAGAVPHRNLSQVWPALPNELFVELGYLGEGGAESPGDPCLADDRTLKAIRDFRLFKQLHRQSRDRAIGSVLRTRGRLARRPKQRLRTVTTGVGACHGHRPGVGANRRVMRPIMAHYPSRERPCQK